MMTDDEIKVEFEARLALAPTRHRSIAEGCDGWDQAKLVEAVKSFAESLDVADLYRGYDKATIGHLVGIGKAIESRNVNMMKSMLHAATSLALVTQRFSCFLDDESRRALTEMAVGIQSHLDIPIEPVPWPEPSLMHGEDDLEQRRRRFREANRRPTGKFNL